jgi:hypothetical protein
MYSSLLFDSLGMGGADAAPHFLSFFLGGVGFWARTGTTFAAACENEACSVDGGAGETTGRQASFQALVAAVHPRYFLWIALLKEVTCQDASSLQAGILKLIIQ